MKFFNILVMVYLLTSCAAQLRQQKKKLASDLKVGTPSFILKKNNPFAFFKETEVDGKKVWLMPGIAKIYFDKNDRVTNWLNFGNDWHETNIEHFGETVPPNKKIFLSFTKVKDTDHLIYNRNLKPIKKSFESLGYSIVKHAKNADYEINLSFIRPKPNVDISLKSDPVYELNYKPSQTYSVSGQHQSNIYNGFNYLGTVKSNTSYQVTTPAEINSVYAGQKTRTVKKVSYTHGIKSKGFKLSKGQRRTDASFITQALVEKSSSESFNDKVPYLFYYALTGMFNGKQGKNYIPLDNSELTTSLTKFGFKVPYRVESYQPDASDYEYGCKKRKLDWCLMGIKNIEKTNEKKAIYFADISCRDLNHKASCVKKKNLKLSYDLRLKKENEAESRCKKGDTKVCYSSAIYFANRGEESRCSYFLQKTVSLDKGYLNIIRNDERFKNARQGFFFSNYVKHIERKERVPANKPY